jgi:hypothetical protein
MKVKGKGISLFTEQFLNNTVSENIGESLAVLHSKYYANTKLVPSVSVGEVFWKVPVSGC